MNWQNFDRLVKHMTTMNPELFNYRRFDPERDGTACLGCQCTVLETGRIQESSVETIEGFLVVSRDDAQYLFCSVGTDAPNYLAVRGEAGVSEALRRLAVVAAHYQRPADEPVTTFVADEPAFLASVKASVSAACWSARENSLIAPSRMLIGQSLEDQGHHT